MSEPVRLVVDAARCDGHGICALRCPELVTLDEWGYAGVDPGTVPDGRVLRRARRAAAACPAQALSFVAVRPAPADLRVIRAGPPPTAGAPRNGPGAVVRVHNQGHAGG
ncbi:MAG TPA: ferredoxin [Acidimicrobiales bacterium]|nr:ferredoxin [Acidimicrobiales bacterium]